MTAEGEVVVQSSENAYKRYEGEERPYRGRGGFRGAENFRAGEGYRGGNSERGFRGGRGGRGRGGYQNWEEARPAREVELASDEEVVDVTEEQMAFIKEMQSYSRTNIKVLTVSVKDPG